jgi:cytochrome P450
MLIDAADVDGGLDDAQVRAEALTIFLAGHETTASALSWTWYLLARHPLVAERLAAELDDVLGGRAPNAEDVPNLRYAHDVFAEAMRLYPPAWMQARRAAHDTTLGEYVVPRGSLMLTSQFVTHRNPRYWDDPDVFRPDRWTEAEAARPRFAYFPFGGGNRRCIGEAFAWMEGVLVLATIASRFAVEAIDAAPVETLTLVTLRPRTAVRVRLRERASTSSA